MKMETIELGSQGFKVSKLGYGCMGLTTAYQPKLPDDEIVNMIYKVYDQGCTFVDTASIYAYMDAPRMFKCQSPIAIQDEIIGRSFDKIGRSNIQFAHKTGNKLSVFPTLKITACGDPTFIRAECEAALERSKTDYIDLFYLHRIDQTIPIEVSMMELKKLVQEGKIKYVGLSECSVSTLRRAHAVHPITAIQMEYSLWCRGIEDELLPTCKELGVGLVAYSPLGRGFFGGAHKQELRSGDYRQSQERFKSDQNIKAYEKVEQIAKQHNCQPAQLALAWVTAQQHRAKGVVAIPGTTKEKNLISNVGSLSLKLTSQQLKALEDAVPPAVGTRYGSVASGFVWESDNNPPLTPELAKKWNIPMTE